MKENNTDIHTVVSQIHDELSQIIKIVNSEIENIQNLKRACQILFRHAKIVDTKDKEELYHIIRLFDNSNNSNDAFPDSSIRSKRYMTDQDDYGYAIIIGYGNNIRHWDQVNNKWVNRPCILSCGYQAEVNDLIKELKETKKYSIKSEYSIKDIELSCINFDKYEIVCLDSLYNNDFVWNEHDGWVSDFKKSSVFTRQTAEIILKYLKDNSILPKI